MQLNFKFYVILLIWIHGYHGFTANNLPEKSQTPGLKYYAPETSRKAKKSHKKTFLIGTFISLSSIVLVVMLWPKKKKDNQEIKKDEVQKIIHEYHKQEKEAQHTNNKIIEALGDIINNNLKDVNNNNLFNQGQQEALKKWEKQWSFVNKKHAKEDIEDEIGKMNNIFPNLNNLMAMATMSMFQSTGELVKDIKLEAEDLELSKVKKQFYILLDKFFHPMLINILSYDNWENTKILGTIPGKNILELNDKDDDKNFEIISSYFSQNSAIDILKYVENIAYCPTRVIKLLELSTVGDQGKIISKSTMNNVMGSVRFLLLDTMTRCYLKNLEAMFKTFLPIIGKNNDTTEVKKQMKNYMEYATVQVLDKIGENINDYNGKSVIFA